MQVVRIEHSETKWGLWRSKDENGYCLIEQLKCHDAINKKHLTMPNALEDLGSRDDNEFCAFKSIDELQQWVKPEWMQELIEVGFKILLLDVTECRIGEYQVLFNKEDIIQSKDITELFK